MLCSFKLKRSSVAVLATCAAFSALGQQLSSPTPSGDQASAGSVNPLTMKFAQIAQFAGNGGTAGGATDALQSQAKEILTQQTQSLLHNMFSYQRGTTEISGGSYQNGIPIWNLLLVRPVWESEDNVHTTFLQGSVFRQGGQETTGNIGLGYRQLVADKKVLLGANTFYDYQFPIGSQRQSLGLEARTSVGEVNANYYVGTTGWMNTANWDQNKALNGYDAELAVAFPFVPSLQARAKTFRWMGTGGINDTFGNTYSLTGAVWQGLYVEAGHSTFNSQYQSNVLLGAVPMMGGNFVKVSWIVGGDRSSNQKTIRFMNTAYKFESMEERRYEKVRRENLIVSAQRNTNFGFYAVGY